MQQKEVDNLTKQEAHEVAKGLNFLDGETRWMKPKCRRAE
jgi:hypothetical protein